MCHIWFSVLSISDDHKLSVIVLEFHIQSTFVNIIKMVQHVSVVVATPWKINMEPTNHPFRKENDLPNLHDDVPC